MSQIKMFALVLLLAGAPYTLGASMQCSHFVDDYLQRHHKEASPYTKEDQLVYFLHVPRTAGRTFHSCFLKMGMPSAKRCPKAYDHLRINMSVPNCNLLSSHDDFSVVSMLPENVAVLTHLRDPVDRFLSAYEFAIEVGARAATRPSTFKKRPNKIATEDVWPWSYLVPWFAADIKERSAKLRDVPQPSTGNWINVKHPDGAEYYYNKVLNVSKWNLTAEESQLLLPRLDPYANELVLPLGEFVRHPIARELLHDGQAFQVLGVTNYSHWGDASELRACVWEQEEVQSRLLDVARARVSRFFHVGVTDKLTDSVTAAAVALGYPLDGPAYSGGEDESAAPRKPLEKIGGGEDDKGGDGKGAQGDAWTAEDIPQLAKRVRDARMALQGQQKELFRTVHEVEEQQEHPKVAAVKEEIGRLRAELRDAQDDLLAARSALPTSTDPKDAQKHEEGAVSPSHMLANPLGVEYQRCAQRAQARNLQRRDQSLQNLAMPDGRFVTFSKEARKAIPQGIIEEIRRLNRMDTALHELASQTLTERRTQWASESKLRDLPYAAPIRMSPRAVGKFKIPKPERDEL